MGFKPTVRQSRTPDFESGPFDHSGIFPSLVNSGCKGKQNLDNTKLFLLIFILPLLQLIEETQNRLYNFRNSKLKQSIQKTTLHSLSLYTACNRNSRRSACHPTRQDRKVLYMVKEHHSCCTIQDYTLYSACRTLS